MLRQSTALLLLTSLTGCGSPAGSAPPPPSLELGVEGTLTVSASANVKGTDLEVKFVGITEDSRCPKDATCVWAGEVKVKMAMRLGSQPPKESEVLEGRSTLLEPYRLTITRVQPDRVSSKELAPGDYRITLVVAKI